MICIHFFCSFVAMTKIVSICCSILILCQSLNMSFEDVSKWNTLIQHASYHHKTYGDSFLDFLAEQYGQASSHHKSDHSEHQNLPFKNHQNCSHSQLSFTLQHLEFIPSNPLFAEIPLNFHYSESSSLFEKLSVFQPPKLA